MKSSVKILASGLLALNMLHTKAQTILQKPAWLNTEMNDTLKNRILGSLDSLLIGIHKGYLDTNLLSRTNYSLNLSTISSLKDYETKDSIPGFYKKQLINFYPVSAGEYFISIAYIGNQPGGTSDLKGIINLVAKHTNGKTTFSLPLNYRTRHWNTQTIQDVTYYFPDKLNLATANAFAAKNIAIATKLGLKPEKLQFYICENQQEILKLLGYAYDQGSNGRTREGYGVDSNTIFFNHEDFSHDVFHYYSAKIRGAAKRNRAVEEGMAYYWGNAYYTKDNGEMTEFKELVNYLKVYIKQNPKANLLELFTNDTKIFTKVPEEISVKSTISGLLCKEVEQKKGIEGIKKLITCGKGDESFFKTLDELLAVNNTNFDKGVRRLIEQYR